MKKALFTLAFAAALAACQAASAQTVKIAGTSANAFSLGKGATKLTLTNSSGTLSLTSGLTVSGGTVNFSGATISNGGTMTTVDINGGTIDGAAIGGSTPAAGAFTTLAASGVLTSTVSTGTAPMTIASTTKVSNLNVDACDGVSLTTGSNGGVVYQSGSATFTATGAGTSGQHLVSGGSGAPTWATLSSAQIWVGNGSNIPAAVTMSGNATLSNAGVLTISNDAVTGARLADAVSDEILTATLSAGSEAGDAIAVTLQVKDSEGNNVSGTYLVNWNISDSSLGTGDTAQSPTVSYTAGAEWHQIVANKKATAFTNSSGALTLSVGLTGDVTVHLNAEVGGKVKTVALDFN